MQPVELGEVSRGLVFGPTWAPSGLELDGLTDRRLRDEHAERQILISRADIADARGKKVSHRIGVSAVHVHDDAGRGKLVAYVTVDHALALLLEASGLDRDELVAVVESIPVVGRRDLFEGGIELPIRGLVAGSEVGEWLGVGLPVRVADGGDLRPLDERISHADLVLVVGNPGQDRDAAALGILDLRVNPLATLAGMLPNGYLLTYGGNPVVVSWDQAATMSNVMWAQRGRFWHLISRMSRPDALSVAERVMSVVREID